MPLLEPGATGLGVALLLPFLDASMGDECASDMLTSSAKNNLVTTKKIKIVVTSNNIKSSH